MYSTSRASEVFHNTLRSPVSTLHLSFFWNYKNNPKLHHFSGSSINLLLFLSVSKWSTEGESNRQTVCVSFQKEVGDRCHEMEDQKHKWSVAEAKNLEKERVSPWESRHLRSRHSLEHRKLRPMTDGVVIHPYRISIWVGLGNKWN